MHLWRINFTRVPHEMIDEVPGESGRLPLLPASWTTAVVYELPREALGRPAFRAFGLSFEMLHSRRLDKFAMKLGPGPLRTYFRAEGGEILPLKRVGTLPVDQVKRQGVFIP